MVVGITGIYESEARLLLLLDHMCNFVNTA